MKINLAKIEKFYETDVGTYAHGHIRDKILKLIGAGKPKGDRHHIVCSAASFILSGELGDLGRYVLQGPDHQDQYPNAGQGHYIVNERTSLAFRAESVDTVILIHDLEWADNPDVYLREIWRVLKGEGQLIIVFPNRSGKWARFDNTPFGRGYPYTLQQMQNMLSKSHFAIDEAEKSLFFPPYPPKTGLAKMYRALIDHVGGICLFEPGVYVVSASKHVYAPTKGLGATTVEKAARALFPKPARASNRTYHRR